MRTWGPLYAASALVSSVACGATAWGLFRRADRQRASAVRFVFFFFFSYSSLWSLLRFVFFSAASLGAVNASADADAEYVDALGLRGVAQSSENTSAWLSAVIVVGDAALMASSMWMLPMAWELTRLARTAMDRGAAREAVAAARYLRWVHALSGLFLAAEAGFTIYNQGFDDQSTRILVSGNMLQALTLLYIAYALLELKCSGRKYETVHGARVLSPLYKRIRSIMVVYAVFSFQYQVLSLVVLFNPRAWVVPAPVVGASTLLFTNSGTALSVVMGCSQECVVRACGRFMPDEYVRAFDAAMDDAAAVPGAAAATTAALVPPERPVFVFTDIEASTQLWAADAAVMRAALELHDDVVRAALARHGGYEVSTAGDAFQLAFHSVKAAVEYCVDVQLSLLAAAWPRKLHDLVPATARKRSTTNKLVFCGLRVRMGVHDSAQELAHGGVLVSSRHPVTGKATYTGLSQVIASEVGDVGAGGQICVTRGVARWLATNSAALSLACDVEFLTSHAVPHVGAVVDVFQVTPAGLEARKKAFAKARRTRDLERAKEARTEERRGKRERLEACDAMEVAVVVDV